MPKGAVDLDKLLRAISARDKPGRTEATVQADIHALLLAAPFELDESEIEDITLESPAGARRRIDIEVGFTIIEVKKDLRVGSVRTDAVEQLTGYVVSRTQQLGQRYVGVVTDGAEWAAYHLAGEELQLATEYVVNADASDVDGLLRWLEGVLATTTRINPTPAEIARQLGAKSSAHALDAADLRALYEMHRDDPTVTLKRELWAKLLTTALGTNFSDADDLFVDHTLLVLTAELVAHAVVGFDLTDQALSPGTIVSGALFTQAQIGGVVEADFFDWIVEVPGGDRFVRTLARRMSRFDWGSVEHDVMKTVYESIIDAEQRHRLGEYYTPDWLAEAVVGEVVDDPSEQRVLDPSCGSGTFLFHAVRRALAAADAQGVPNGEALVAVTRRVIGVDVHPVAVTLARVTFLLALGRDRLQSADRPPLAIPVYLGDSLQWGQQRNLLSSNALTVATDDGAQLFADELRFPDRLLADAGQFDRLVAELADKATDRAKGSAPPSLSAVFRRFAVHDDDQAELTSTFGRMCQLHDAGRDHIWGYYVRNLARPVWLSHPENRVDRIVGNPPWLAYRFMTREQQDGFRAMSTERRMWAGGTVATNQDLSGLFLARAVQLYLRPGGRFGMVMPLATLSRQQYAGFRAASWPSPEEPVTVAFDPPWDLDKVKPAFFEVKAAVVLGARTAGEARPMPSERDAWSGRLPAGNPPWAVVSPALRRTASEAQQDVAKLSPYQDRFSQGATLVPRMLFVVDDWGEKKPLGVGAGRRAVRSRRTRSEKKPWIELAGLQGHVEAQFVMGLHLGETLLPFELREPLLAVIPWDGKRLLSGGDERLDLYPGLAEWWRSAERVWDQHKSATTRLSLVEQLDYRRKLKAQFPVAPHRVVYTASGQYLAAAPLNDPTVVVEKSLYWAAVSGREEAMYLCGVLNSGVATETLAPLQARGEHNPRHFDKYVWALPVATFDPADSLHVEISSLAEEATEFVKSFDLPNTRFERQRTAVRTSLAADRVGRSLDRAVRALFDRSMLAES